MIFKYIGGLSFSPTGKALWRSSATSSENTIAALDTTTTFQGNYKNRLVQSWQTLNPQEVSAENTYITEGWDKCNLASKFVIKFQYFLPEFAWKNILVKLFKKIKQKLYWADSATSW